MQLAGKTAVWAIVAGLTLALGVGFGSGLLVGRQFPMRRFERFGNTRYLLDTTTGKVCDPFKNPNANPADLSDLFPPTPAKDANGFEIVKPNPFDVMAGTVPPSYPPACGK